MTDISDPSSSASLTNPNQVNIPLNPSAPSEPSSNPLKTSSDHPLGTLHATGIPTTASPPVFRKQRHGKSKIVLKAAIKRHFGRTKSSHFAALHDVIGKLRLLVFLDQSSDDEKEIAIFCNQHTSLPQLLDNISKRFSYADAGSCRLYFPLEPISNQYTSASPVSLTPAPQLTLIDTQPLFNKAFALWTLRAFQMQKVRIQHMTHQFFDCILSRDTSQSEKATAALQLAELAMSDENLQHFNDDILKAIIGLLNVPIDEVAEIMARTVWILSGLYEVAEVIIRLKVIPRLLKMFTFLGLQPLTTAREAKVQLSIVGALSRLIASVPAAQHSIYMPDIAAVMSVASARSQDEALDLIETDNADGVPDEASTNQYAADTLCLIIHEYPDARQILTYPNAVARLAVNLKSSKTDLLRCATITLSIIVRDHDLRKNISVYEAIHAFDALVEICEWCCQLLESTSESNNDLLVPSVPETTTAAIPIPDPAPAPAPESLHRHVPEHELSDTIPSILETAIVSLWGCASIVRQEIDLSTRAEKYLSKDRKLTASEGRRRASSVGISDLDVVPIDDEVWMDLCQKISVLNDPRVDVSVNSAATAVIGCMLQHPNSAFVKNMLTHILKLLEPWHGLLVRSSAAVAFARLCAAELNLSRQRKPHYSEKWARFCQHMLSGCGIDIVLTCAFPAPPALDINGEERSKTEEESDAEYQLRAASASAMLYMCAQYKGPMGRVQLSSLVSLLACDSNPDVQLYACSAIWCVARTEANRKSLGDLRACKCLLDVMFNTDQKRIQEWCAAALWLLSTHTPNAVEIALQGYAISKMITLMRPDTSWDAKSFVTASRNFSKAQYGDILSQNLVGTLRRVVATEEGSKVITQQKLGYTLIETLYTIVQMKSAKIELLRESAGLLFFLQESPENRECISLVAESNTALEDLYLMLLNKEGSGQEALHREAAHALTGLACSSTSRLYIGRNGGVDLLYAMLKENLIILNALDGKIEAGTADKFDHEEFDQIYENLKICLNSTLNLSVEQEFHVNITQKFLKVFLEFALDEEDKEIGTIACKIICNLERSSNFTVQNLVYKAQLGLAGLEAHKASIINEMKSEASKVLTFGKKIGEDKGHNANRLKTQKYLKGSICPEWFLQEYPNADRNSSIRGDSVASLHQKSLEGNESGTIMSMNENNSIAGDTQSQASLTKFPGDLASVTSHHTQQSKDSKITLENIVSVDAYGRQVVFDVDEDDGGTVTTGRLSPQSQLELDQIPLPAFPQLSGNPQEDLTTNDGPSSLTSAVNILGNKVGPPAFGTPPNAKLPSPFKVRNASNNELVQTTGIGITHTTRLPTVTDPWKPQAVLQVMETTIVPDPESMLRVVNKETLVLPPNHKYSRITFKTAIDKYGRKKQFNHSESSAPVTMYRWEHTPGSVVTQDYFECVDGLDRRQYIYFKNPNGLGMYREPAFDTQHPGIYPDPPIPDSIVYIGSGFPPPPSGLLPDYETEVPHYKHNDPPAAPRPTGHSISVCREACTFVHGGKCPGKSCKLHGTLPVKDAPWFCRPAIGKEKEIEEEVILFDPSGSIFNDRKKHADSKSFFNTSRVYGRTFEHDWKRGTETKRFSKFLTIHDARIKSGEMTIDKALKEVKTLMKKNTKLLLQSFQYYCIMSPGMGGYGSGSTNIHQNAYMKFLNQVQGSRDKVDDDRFQELVRTFLTVNLVEDKKDASAKFNQVNSLLKQEWIEVIARVAVILNNAYEKGNTTVTESIADVFGMMRSNLPTEAIEDDDDYRRKRLYTFGVNDVLEKYKSTLYACHVVYPVSNHKMRTKKAELKLELFGLDDWERLMSDSEMYQNGLNRSDSKAAFMKARMQVTDEITHRQKDTSLSLVDFYEALCRSADYWSVEGGMSSGGFSGSPAENLERFLLKMFEGLAVSWKGELRCQCHGHAWDQKKFASLMRWLPKEDAILGIQKQADYGNSAKSPMNSQNRRDSYSEVPDSHSAPESALGGGIMSSEVVVDKETGQEKRISVVYAHIETDDDNPYHH
ncbi:hypothetical protein TrST_g6106 [Triparma strigata]|uniref:Vacuolar protein 8 n=1 Tax=Triparma strigata TaxID=1606541 RepID=A0A9W7C2E7_9STRA|nr:hypothetical protein TrST_g6106 [Triparma strigata]